MKKPEVPNVPGSNLPEKKSPLRNMFPIRKPLRPFWHKPAPELMVDDEIILKSLTSADGPRVFELVDANRRHLQEWLTWIEKIQTLKDSMSFVRNVRYRDIFEGRWVYGVWYMEELVGLIDFNEGDKENNQVALGYWLNKEHQGKGIITRAVSKCLDYAFDEQHIHKVIIRCATNNLKSQAIPMRLNFTWEGMDHNAGTVNGKTVDMVAYGMLYRDWARLST